jgi:hypothetical protein
MALFDVCASSWLRHSTVGPTRTPEAAHGARGPNLYYCATTPVVQRTCAACDTSDSGARRQGNDPRWFCRSSFCWASHCGLWVRFAESVTLQAERQCFDLRWHCAKQLIFVNAECCDFGECIRAGSDKISISPLTFVPLCSPMTHKSQYLSYRTPLIDKYWRTFTNAFQNNCERSLRVVSCVESGYWKMRRTLNEPLMAHRRFKSARGSWSWLSF